eukprot:1151147-Pelagomonas_calceolata.AAC.1
MRHCTTEISASCLQGLLPALHGQVWLQGLVCVPTQQPLWADVAMQPYHTLRTRKAEQHSIMSVRCGCLATHRQGSTVAIEAGMVLRWQYAAPSHLLTRPRHGTGPLH